MQEGKTEIKGQIPKEINGFCELCGTLEKRVSVLGEKIKLALRPENKTSGNDEEVEPELAGLANSIRSNNHRLSAQISVIEGFIDRLEL